MRRVRLAVAAALTLGATPVQAQRDPILSPLAGGAQVGAPGGLTVRFPARTVRGWTGSVGVVGDDGVTVAAHRYRQFGLPDSPLHLFVALGVFAGRQGGEAAAGVRAEVGAGFYAARFEIFLQAAPGLRLTPSVRRLVQPAVGVRYAF